MSTPAILILYYSRGGQTATLAEALADGVYAVPGVDARLRTVPSLHAGGEPDASAGPDDPYADPDDLRQCIGLAMGSPTRFGTMAAPLKHWWEHTTPEWLNGDLVNKPACVFTSTGSLHGGQEATLLSMMLPLLHHGMMLLGTPYTEAELHTTESGGTPYGVSHWDKGKRGLSKDEIALANAQGKRLAQVALRMASEEKT